MGTIKSYTDIEQSKKLAEILPLESADMAYWKRSYRPTDYTIMAHHTKELQRGFEAKGIEYIPAWSLAALISVLPKIHGLKPILDLEENSIQYSGIDLYITASNPIDACYEMIIKLNELNLL